MLAGFHEAVRVRGIGQRKTAVSLRLDGAGGKIGPDMLFKLAANRTFFRLRAWPQAGARNSQMFSMDKPEIRLDDPAGPKIDENKAPLVSKKVKLSRDIGTANDIKNDVHTTAAGK